MIKYDLFLDGVSANDMGIRFLSSLVLSEPVPRSTAYTVPGRNGDVHIYDGSFKNRTATVEGCLYSEDFVKSGFAKLNSWLFGSLGYRKLRTDDDPSHFLMARITNGPEIAAKARKVAPFRIKFDCKPQRFLADADVPQDVLSSGKTFTSASSFDARPLLEIRYNASLSSAQGTVTINGKVINLNFLEAANYSSIFYDAETTATYVKLDDGSMLAFNSVVGDGENAVISPGSNRIEFGGAVTSLAYTPRWWDL